MKNENRKTEPYLPPVDKKKMEELSGEVEWLQVDLNRHSTETAILTGMKLLVGERLVRKTYGKKRGVWEKFLKVYFKGLKPRKRQRCMKLGTIDLKKYPHLKYLSQRSLLSLMDLAAGADVGKFLARKKVKFSGKISPKHMKPITIFRKKVADLIDRSQEKKASEKSSGPEANATKKARNRPDMSVMTSINAIVGFIDSIDSEEEFEEKITPLLKAKLVMPGGKYDRFSNPPKVKVKPVVRWFISDKRHMTFIYREFYCEI